MGTVSVQGLLNADMKREKISDLSAKDAEFSQAEQSARGGSVGGPYPADFTFAMRCKS